MAKYVDDRYDTDYMLKRFEELCNFESEGELDEDEQEELDWLTEWNSDYIDIMSTLYYKELEYTNLFG